MSSSVRFQKIESNIPIGCIDSLKSPFFDGNFVFSRLIQYKNFDEHLPGVGACAVKARGQELPRVGHLILFNLCQRIPILCTNSTHLVASLICIDLIVSREGI